MRIRRMTALFTAILLVLTSLPAQSVRAEEISEDGIEITDISVEEDDDIEAESYGDSGEDITAAGGGSGEDITVATEDIEIPNEPEERLGNSTFTLDANGGLFLEGYDEEGFPDYMDTCEVADGDENLSDYSYIPEWDGYWFCGWYKESSCVTRLS
nr:hypothetical protein [Lachnospiraceae bacterium]